MQLQRQLMDLIRSDEKAPPRTLLYALTYFVIIIVLNSFFDMNRRTPILEHLKTSNARVANAKLTHDVHEFLLPTVFAYNTSFA